ncbi:MAG: Calx-beta domain-containing protein [Chthoniobacteraceae bacterium]
MRYRLLLASLVAIVFGAVVFLLWEDRAVAPQAPAILTTALDSGRMEVAKARPAAQPVVQGGEAVPAFSDWTGRFLATPREHRQALVTEGVRLASERRPVFKQLIQDDPRAAIEQAVPMVVRQELPPIVLAQLERRINDIGALRVMQGVPLNPGDPPVPTYREVELKGGGTYRAYVYGQREQKLTWTAGAFVNGVAVDSEFAVSDQPTRRLEAGENMPPGKPVVSECPVSGKIVLDPASVPSVVPESLPAVETPVEIITFCDGSHIAMQNETILYGEGVTGGSFAFSGILPSTPTPALGQVKVLVIPTTYADQNAIPSTEAALYTTLRDVADHYAKASYGRLSLVGVVTPPVKLPHNEAWYVNRDTSNGGDIGGTSISHVDARNEARKLGFDSSDYDCVVMRHNGGPGSYGGLAGGSTVWCRSDSVSLWAHEIGHCFGLGHSNFWDTAGTSSIGNGANNEYGDSYDVMGGAGTPPGHYNAQGKNQIRWLPGAFLQPVTQSGLYRIHAFDQGSLDASKRYALTIQKDVQRTYWGMVRSLFDSNPFAKNGLVFGWRFPSGGGGNFQLIDTTNGSPYGKTDAPISLGATFGDTESGIYVTAVAASDSPRYLDVQVNLGSSPGNQPPTMSLAASAEVIPLNGTVTFTATANDPDSDPLAFNWQHFGGGTQIVSPNSNVITRQFTAAGTFIVTCTASDMKGGTVTRNKLITVGSAATFTISGRVTLLGQGLQDVVVTANNANGVISDADGYFTIPNLSANTYTLTPLLYGYTFSELFNNSIVVGPSFSGAEFEASAQSVVTISAPAPSANELAPVTPGAFRVTRTGDTSQDLVVNVNTALGGATKTTDYTFTPDYVTGSQGFSTFTIPADSDMLDIIVTPVVDASSEGPETVILQLGPGNGYLVGSASSAMVVIEDDDTLLPKVSLAATTATTTENSASPAVFTVSRTGSTAAGLTVNYAVTGTATSGSDFTALSGSVTIPSGLASATVEVAPLDDSLSESIETAILTLSTNAAYIIDTLATTGTASIYDDDLQTVSVTATDTTATEVDLSIPGAAADTGTFLVSRTGDTSQPLTIYYAFSGTNASGVMALHGVDFEWMPGLIQIPAGQDSAAVTIVPRFDGVGEGVEQCVLTLGASATNYILGTGNSATVNITDAAGDTPYIDVVNTVNAVEGSTSANFRLTVRGGSSGTAIPIELSVGGTADQATDYKLTAWGAQTSGITTSLRGLWIADATNLWAVGDAGRILKGNGATWATQTSGTTNNLRGIWGSSATSLWAVGDSGRIVKGDGSAWVIQTSGTTNTLRGIWGSSATSLWTVGNTGTIRRSTDGTSWSAQTSGTTTNLYAVWGSDANNVWAVGDAGTILKWNGTAWAAQTSGTTGNLRGVWGSSATNLWAVGVGGVILKGNGTTWTAQTSGVTQDLNGIWGSDASSVWISGSSGMLLRTLDGSSWSSSRVTTNNPSFQAVSGANADNVWVSGDSGSVYEARSVDTSGSPASATIPQNAPTFDLICWPVNDTEPEDFETISVTLSPTVDYQTYAPTTSATAWLRDDDNVNTLVVDTQVGTSGAISFTEGATTTPVKFYVSRLGSTTSAVTVNCSYSGTATGGGVDYTAPASVTIPAGATGVDVPITVANDTTFEGTETILFDFAPGAYARGVGAVMYITDNDTVTATVGFQAPSSTGSESVTTVNIPVVLSSAQASPVTVEYQTGAFSTGSSASNTSSAVPHWVRLVKTGTTVAFFQSHDGQIWTERGSAVAVSGLGDTSYLAGIVFAPGSTTQYTTTIDNFSVSNLSGGSTGAEVAASIGTVTGGSSSSSGVYTFTNSGNGLTNSTADNFRFVYLPVNGSANCTVTARITSVGNSGSTSSRAGVMLRASTAGNAVHASSLGTGVAAGNFYTLHRTGAGATATLSSAFTGHVPPMWARTVRAGSVFTQSFSRDGVSWTDFGTAPGIAFAPKVFAGLAVSAASDGALATATFDNVTLNGSPLTTLGGRTIGFVNAQGDESHNAGVWTVTGSGAGIATGSDEAHFPSTEVTGDFTLIARVTSLTGGANGAQAGVMVRDDRTHYARGVHTGWVKSGAMEQRYRLQSNTTAFGSGVDFVLPPGVLTFDPGQTTKNLTFTVVNDTMDEPDNLITIQLINPLGAGLGTFSYHGYTILDNDTPPAQPYVGFATGASSVVENAGTVQIAVALSAPATAPCSVDFITADGSATQPGDYTTTTGTLNFAAGESVKIIAVPITDNAAVESAENFTVTLQAPANLNLGSASAHTITITDDDFPTVNIVATDASAAESGDTGTFTITRAGSLAGNLVVNFTRSGTAASGTDYTAIASPGNATILDGQANATVTVTPLQDATNEGNETVILTLTANAAYTLGTPANATVTIADDDRSTVTIVANDPDASETAGNPGQFTVTRTAPTTGSLTVNLTISGTATNTTDYANVAATVAFVGGESSKVVNIAPVDDAATEGPEDVTISLNTGSYDIGAQSFDNVAITDNDNPPTVFINSPTTQGPLIAAANGVIVSASVSDDGFPAPLTTTWSCVSGPGTASIESPSAATTAVTFSAPGTYVLRITASDTQFTASDQITIVAGSGLVASNWITQDLGPSSARRGQGLEYGGLFSVTGTGAGYASTSTDQAHIMVRAATGDGSVVARLTSLNVATALAGVTIRDSLARGSTRAVLGYVPGTGLQFRTRATSGNDTSVGATAPALPCWLKLERNATTNEVSASYAPDVSGAPGAWTAVGSPVVIPLLNTNAHYGLTTTNNSTAGSATAIFDNVTLTPAPGGPALVNEDSGTAPNLAGSGSFDGTTYTLAGPTTGYFYGWQYYGDMVFTARLNTYSSGAGSSSGGIRVAESIESGAQLHLGRMPTGAYSGYYWTSIAAGGGGGVPSGIAAGNWMRIVRRGNSITGYRATHNVATNGPNAWTQIGQAQTVIMTTPVWVGFYVNNASGATGTLNTCTFTRLTIEPLNIGPDIDLSALPFTTVGDATLDATVIDDGNPAPTSLATTWSKAAGPGNVMFGNTSAVDTSASFPQFGDYTLRLRADDTGIVTFRDALMTHYESAFQQWQAQNFGGDPNDPNAAPGADPEHDGFTNFLEWAVGLSPGVMDAAPWTLDEATIGPDKFLRLAIPKNPDASGVTFQVEATSGMTVPMNWSSDGLIIEENTSTLLRVRDSMPMSSGGSRFMRAKVSQ